MSWRRQFTRLPARRQTAQFPGAGSLQFCHRDSLRKSCLLRTTDRHCGRHARRRLAIHSAGSCAENFRDALEKSKVLVVLGRAATEGSQQWIGVLTGAPFQVEPGRRWEDTSRAAIVSMGFAAHKVPLLQESKNRGDRIRIRADAFHDLDLRSSRSDHHAAEHHVLVGRDAMLQHPGINAAMEREISVA